MKTKNKWNEWLIDVSSWPDYCFVPYEKETDSIVFGLNMIQEHSPDKLVGVIHSNGQETVENWCLENPDWKEKYSEL